MAQIKIEFDQSELDYLDAIEALHRECGLSLKEAEALVEVWGEATALTSQNNHSTENTGE